MSAFNETSGILSAAGFLPTDRTKSVSGDIQRLIDENPNRTIYFPDGVYLLDKPILTPADPKKSVSLALSDFAVFRAAENWNSDGALVRLGGKEPANDIRTCGSNYSFSGGIIDGCQKADGISIDGGRETVVRNVSIKHTKIGLHIKHGANSGSSDCDISGVNIIGNRTADSIGVLLEGYDNTLTNMRIADVFTGVLLKSAGNSLRNIHPLYTCDYTDYTASCGFDDRIGSNWYDFCYSDQFGIGFRMSDGCVSIYDRCFCFWYSEREKIHTAIKSEGSFDSIFTNLRVGFKGTNVENNLIVEARPGGRGSFVRPAIQKNIPSVNRAYEAYLSGGVTEY